MGMSMLKIEIWLCKRIKIWNLYLTRKHHLLLLKTGFPTYSPFETIPCHWGHGLKETTPPTTKMEPEKKTTWNRRETSTETTTFFGFHVSSRGVGRCISEPKWSLIYLHSFSQKGGAGEFCWVKKNEQWKEPWLFHANISLASLQWPKTASLVEQNTWTAGTDYLNFPHYFNVLHLRGRKWEGKFLDLIPRLQICWFKCVNPSGDDGRHTGWGNRSKGKKRMFGCFFS